METRAMPGPPNVETSAALGSPRTWKPAEQSWSIFDGRHPERGNQRGQKFSRYQLSNDSPNMETIAENRKQQ